MKLRVAVADDEALARKEIRRLLLAQPGVEVVGEAKDGDEAVALIEKQAPDLVFLDIRMPGRDGFGVLDALEPPLPEVVFCTAYDQFAVDAVRRGALDYLLKPIAPEDLAQALRRAEEKINRRAAKPGEKPVSGRLGRQDRVFVRDGKKAMFLEIGKIFCLEAHGNYTKVLSPEGHILMRRPLHYYEEKLEQGIFLRANRSQMINLDQVRHWEPMGEGRLKATLEGGLVVEVSRRQARLFQEKCRL